MKKLGRTTIAGIGLGVIAVACAAINIFNPTTTLGVPYVPAYRLPFIASGGADYGITASDPLQSGAAYGCALGFTSQAGFPFATNQYGHCGDSESRLAIGLNWVIVALLALGSVVLMAGSFGNLGRLLSSLARRVGNIPAYVGLATAAVLVVLQQFGQLSDQLHNLTNYWLPGSMVLTGVAGWQLSRTRPLSRASLAILGLGALLIVIASYDYGMH